MRINSGPIAIILCSTFLVACGGGGSNSIAEDVTSTGNIGFLMDGTVSGVSYVTPTLRGVTSSDGSFHYEDEETVRFAVGDTVLGEVPGKEQVTPFDLAGTAAITGTATISAAINRSNDPFHQVTNIAVFLQSLDADGDPQNGIEVTADVHDLFNGVSLDLKQHWSTFRDSLALRRAMARANGEDHFSLRHGITHPALALQHLYETLKIDPKIFGLTRSENFGDMTSTPYSISTYAYDDNGFPIQHQLWNQEFPDEVFGEFNETWRWRYDANGNMTGHTSEAWYWWQWRYDEVGNLIGEEDHYNNDETPDSRTSYQYDGSGNLVRSELDTEGDGEIDAQRTLVYGDESLLTLDSFFSQGADPRSEVAYEYDEEHRLIRETLWNLDTGSNPGDAITTTWQYNAGNQLVHREVSYDDGVTQSSFQSWEFDTNGRLSHTRQGDNGEPAIEGQYYYYDAQGRLVRKEDGSYTPFSDSLSEWEFNETSTLYRTYYDSNGDGQSDTIFIQRTQYDTNGNPILEENDLEGDGVWDLTTSFEYDADGNQVLETYRQNQVLRTQVTRQYTSTGWGHIFTSLNPPKPGVDLNPEPPEPAVTASAR